MTRTFHIALFVTLCVGCAAVAAPPAYQLRAAQDLVGMRAGGALDVRVEAQSVEHAKAVAAEAAGAWSLVVAPCSAIDGGTARLVPMRAHDGVFRLTVPTPRSADDPHMCVARWAGGAIVSDPMRLRFCVGDLTLRECHPGWWAQKCKGLLAPECDRRAIAAGVKHGDDPSGLIYVEQDGRRRKVPWTGGSGCPVHAERWGVVFARAGKLMALDIGAMKASPVVEPPDGVAYRSPWPDGRGGMLLVAEGADGRRLLRAPSACAEAIECTVEPLRVLPAAAGRIIGRAGGAVLMTHRLSRHAVRVPLDPKQTIEQLSIAAPLGDCSASVGGARVTNDGAPPAAR